MRPLASMTGRSTLIVILESHMLLIISDWNEKKHSKVFQHRVAYMYSMSVSVPPSECSYFRSICDKGCVWFFGQAWRPLSFGRTEMTRRLKTRLIDQSITARPSVLVIRQWNPLTETNPLESISTSRSLKIQSCPL